VTTLWQWATVEQPGLPAALAPAATGTFSIPVALRLDPLTATMLSIITCVGLLVAIYSAGYMHGDPGYPRFFVLVSMFVFSMTMLVAASNFLLVYVFWEAVGACSYLLIGFWYTKPEAARAAKKAFLVNRVGDFGLAVATFLLWMTYGTLNFHDVTTADGTLLPGILGPARLGDAAGYVGGAVGVAICLLLLLAACGKSAQLPLHVWLPDAMEGPTPASALIHAATMVTAGVYLTARMSGIYMMAPEASQVIAVVGVLTAFFAATVALVQTDIKKVLAYSTVSQLGFMFLALGVGAYGVAIFHVVTHAFFKACLFLGAGSVIHALGGEQDIRKMGGLRNKIPLTFWTFAIATAAIAGIPGLAGFFSKDEILWYAFASAKGGAPWLWAMAALTALMTAFYMFRLLWLTFMGASRMSHEVEHHVHESPLTMTGVLMLLALLSAGGGYIAIPHFLEAQMPLPPIVESLEHYEHTLLYVSIVLAFAGLGLAVFMFGGPASRPEGIKQAMLPIHRLLSGRYFVDELYERVIVKPLAWFSEVVLLRGSDQRLLDGSLNGLASLAQRSAGLLSRVQTGSLQLYALLITVGIVGALLWSWRHV
jgi:NADH-quinone oxidoreductase subunit L